MSSPWRTFTWVLGISLILTCIYLPAGALRPLFDDLPGIEFVRTSGTVWSGRANLVSDIGLSAAASWRVGLLAQSPDGHAYAPHVAWQVSGTGLLVEGRSSVSWGAIDTHAQADIDRLAIAEILADYNLRVSGRFSVPPMHLRQRGETLTLISGNPISWSGGEVSYLIGDRFGETILPPLSAQLSIQESNVLHLEVRREAEGTKPLMWLRLDPSRRVRIDLSRGFLNLVNYAWPGNEPEDTVVLTVERSLN